VGLIGGGAREAADRHAEERRARGAHVEEECGVRWCGGKLPCFPRDWRGPKCKIGAAKCGFGPGGRALPRVGLIPRVTGFGADSTSISAYPNEALGVSREPG
jgi:hypothetical protein